MKFRASSFLMLLAAAAFIGSGSAWADDIIIDFTGGLPGGTVSYAGGTAELVGQGLNILGVTGVGTPLNNAENRSPLSPGFQVVDSTGLVPGVLTFRTGSFSGMNGSSYVFQGGGSFAIHGAVLNDDGTTAVAYQPLLWGSLLGAEVDRLGTIRLVLSHGTDTKAADLLRFFGLSPTTTFAFSGAIQLRNFRTVGNGFTASGNGSTDISNTALVPEPASMALLGSVILLLGTKLRKKLLH